MTVDALTRLLQEHFEGDQIDVHDMTGTMDHFELEIVSARFQGKSLIEQHKMVHAAVAEHLGGAIHAVKIKTRTP